MKASRSSACWFRVWVAMAWTVAKRILDAVFHLFHKQLLLLLSPLALSDIPGNFGSADDPAIGIFERRYRQRDIDQTSVLAATDGIVMINALPRRTRSMISGSSSMRSAGIRIVIGLPMTSSGLVAEQPLGTAIPACNDAVEVLADNRVVRRFDN